MNTTGAYNLTGSVGHGDTFSVDQVDIKGTVETPMLISDPSIMSQSKVVNSPNLHA